MANLKAPSVQLQPVSVTRKMAASLPGLRARAEEKGLKIHHLGAGYPHPEVTDPRRFLEHKAAYFAHVAQRQGLNDPQAVPEYLRESYSYTDTLGPVGARRAFALAYGSDWGVQIDPGRLIPTVGATGGIHLACSLFEHAGQPLAYITDAPTYAGFTARSDLCQHARIYSVEMDEEGAKPELLRAQIQRARDDGRFVPFYYTIPDGHNPAGFSFSARRREQILEVVRDAGVLILEDAPYVYISFAEPSVRPRPFLAMAPEQTIHLFTGSKIGFPGPRVGFLYSEAELDIEGGRMVRFSDLALTEAAASILFQNPEALWGFDAMLHDESFRPMSSMWPLADAKLAVYRENRAILLERLEVNLGGHRHRFHWTTPEAGFFSVFTFLDGNTRTDETFIERLVSEHGVVAIPMHDFYPRDARQRDPAAGLNQLRLSFCFSESIGEARRYAGIRIERAVPRRLPGE
jgi:DNA-binding transcriptional MocR family regulator